MLYWRFEISKCRPFFSRNIHSLSNYSKVLQKNYSLCFIWICISQFKLDLTVTTSESWLFHHRRGGATEFILPDLSSPKRHLQVRSEQQKQFSRGGGGVNKIGKQNKMFYVIDKDFKLFEGQQCLPGLDLLNNTNFNSKTHEIIYQPIKKLKR